MILLKLIGSILAVFIGWSLLYILCLTVYYMIKNTSEIVKEAEDDDRDREP